MNSNDQRQLTLYGTRRSGRTSTAVSWALMHMSEGKSGLWVAPTNAQCTLAQMMIKDMVDDSNVHRFVVTPSSRIIEFTNGASLRFIVPDPSRSKGRFVDFVVVDNADEFTGDDRLDWLMTQQNAKFLWIREVKVEI